MNQQNANTAVDDSALTSASGAKCVLLVEDDRSVRRYLEVILQRSGYEVITAADGVEAMKIALTSPVDVVITDAIMPHMGGLELARFLRSQARLKKVRIVLLSGQETKPGVGSEKVDAFLSKPVRAEDLKNCLARLLA